MTLRRLLCFRPAQKRRAPNVRFWPEKRETNGGRPYSVASVRLTDSIQTRCFPNWENKIILLDPPFEGIGQDKRQPNFFAVRF